MGSAGEEVEKAFEKVEETAESTFEFLRDPTKPVRELLRGPEIPGGPGLPEKDTRQTLFQKRAIIDRLRAATFAPGRAQTIATGPRGAQGPISLLRQTLLGEAIKGGLQPGRPHIFRPPRT